MKILIALLFFALSMVAGQCSDIFPEAFDAINKEDAQLALRFEKLCDVILGHGNAIVAYSGGTDSALLAFLASELLDRCLCITFDSFLISNSERESALAFARKNKLEHRIVNFEALDHEPIRENHPDRCYHCKTQLLEVLQDILRNENLDIVLEGSNTDDLGEYRPGRKAVEEQGVESPYLEAGLCKSDIRKLSKHLGLETWNHPAMACLATRFPYNSQLTIVGLARVGKAEFILRDLGYRNVRVRVHDHLARIELGQDEEIDIIKLREIIPYFKALGFRQVTLDLEGYRTGNFDEQ
ncbi:MAG: ATP-dependent sacrificial sulfur transferase LarE [Thermoplasmata archaeon]|nr:ATP-dependent sacrificial sulfur transferase LarE [Thermoplasmata archaeon]